MLRSLRVFIGQAVKYRKDPMVQAAIAEVDKARKALDEKSPFTRAHAYWSSC